MKRFRFPAVMLTLLLTAALLFSPRSQAATYNGEPVFFTVINDSLIDLTYATMPIYRNGIIYVPYTVLSDHFDIRSTYSADEQVLFLSNGDTMIKFDIRNQKTYDSNQKELRQPAITAKGLIFIPAQFTANYLGLGYIYLPDSKIVRLGDQRVSYPDAFLASYLQEEMNAALANLKASGGTTAGSAASTATTLTSTTLPPRSLRLAFLSVDPQGTQELLTQLTRHGLTAAFFLDSARIEADPLSVVQLRIDGQLPGVYADTQLLPEPDEPAPEPEAQDDDISVETAVDPERVLRAMEEVNERYYALLREKSRLLLLDGADMPELRSLGRSAGYLSCFPTHRFLSPVDTESLLSDVTTALQDGQGDVLLLLTDDDVTVQAFPKLIAALRQMGFVLSDLEAFGAEFTP